MKQPAPIVTRLMGGLGNQMFQYATGLALARKLHTHLLVDRSFLDARPGGMDWTARGFELDVFRCPVELAPQDLITDLRTVKRPALLRRQCWYRERHKRFHDDLPAQRAPLLLEGYWQCERYFTTMADELRTSLFVPRAAPSARNEDLRAELAAVPHASVHVRLGDYVTNSSTAAYHGALPPGYYERTMDELRDMGVVRFLVFSDRPEEARARITFPAGTTFVEHNTGRDAHWDLWLMRHCRHHIIANSSFSWWGAWLNPSPEKTVIAPIQWFAGDTSPNDIVPDNWSRR